MSSKLSALLWKSIQLRKNNLVFVLIETLIPCLFLVIVSFIYRTALISDTPNSILCSDKVHLLDLNHKTDYINRLNETHYYLLYSGNSPEADVIMKKINLNKRLEKFENISEMEKKFRNITHKNSIYLFGIDFAKIDKTNHLFDYKIISIGDGWLTDQVVLENDNPHLCIHSDVYFEKGFYFLQLALDNAFITWSTGLGVDNYNFKTRGFFSQYTVKKPQTSKNVFALAGVLGFLVMYSHTMKLVVEDKVSGVNELMKMLGIKSWMVWISWIFYNAFVYIVITIIIICFQIYGMTENATNIWMINVHPLISSIILVMYMVSGLFFSLAISGVFKHQSYAIFFGSTIWFMTYSLTYFYVQNSKNCVVKIILSIFPNVAMIKVFETMNSPIFKGKQINFSNLFEKKQNSCSFSIGELLIVFAIQSMICGFIAWCLDLGVIRNYDETVLYNYFCKSLKQKTENDLTSSIRQENTIFFEEPPKKLEVKISAQNVYKCYGHHYALGGIDLNFYKGEISVIVGYNGAGKTTLLSIIAGNHIYIWVVLSYRREKKFNTFDFAPRIF